MPNWILHGISNLALLGAIWYANRKTTTKEEMGKYALAAFGANLIDIDHLLATPIYDPDRCGINYHPLHSWYMIPIYFGGLFFKNKYVRVFFASVLIHLTLDAIDCF